MLNITRNIKRLNIALSAALVALIMLPATTCAQDSPGPARTARGIAPVSAGNMSAARAAALTDAQKKVVLAALADQMPLEKLNGAAAALQPLFFNKPDVYLQRFKIISETTVAGALHILIEAAANDELIRSDLATIGLYKPPQQKIQLLLMVTEDAADGNYACWWAVDPAQRVVPFDAGGRMAELLRERGIEVLDPGTLPLEQLAPSQGEVFPARGALLEAARRSGAAFVVMARAAVKPASSPAGSTVAHAQCDLQAEVLDVHTREMRLHSATNALGTHIDQEAAAQDAVAKACSRIVEYILDRLPDANANNYRHSFRFAFPGPLTESTAHDFFKLLRAALPEIIRIAVRETDSQNIRAADIVSSLDAAALTQKALQADLKGYTITPGAEDDSGITLSVMVPGTR
ncbi:MAG: hypothetical protein FJ119_02710 [Deltaproteobacteria bacterium]|nr:hypothetical protein [Deltaproteobacteria bacterium]